MSALPVTPPTRQRAPLRLVPAPDAARTADTGTAARVDHLAPSSRAQAWRRRTTALLVLLAPLVVAAFALAPVGPAMDPVATSGTVVVEPGQTLWGIAAATAPDGVSTAEQVDRIVERNAMDGTSLQAWQVVWLP